MTKLRKYQQLKKEIEEMRSQIKMKEEELKKWCPHPKEEIKCDTYYDDEWAHFENRIYTRSFYCNVCGTYASSNTNGKGIVILKSDKYDALYNQYNK